MSNREAPGIARIIPADERGIARAVEALAAGKLIGLPTETVYGLAADATNGLAVAAIFAAKGRPSFNPLISHVSGIEAAEELADFPHMAITLAETFWPGPLTLVLKRRPGAAVHDLATAGLDTIALRAPAHRVARQVLLAFGKPVAAPSANPSGKLSPTRPEHVTEGLGHAVALVLDGGACAIGLESTVVEVTEEAVYLLRPGSITEQDLAEVLGRPVRAAGEDIRSPGQLASHYAPEAQIRLNALNAAEGEKLLGFGQIEGDLNLSPKADLRAAAANLFTMLRLLDKERPKAIAVAPIPNYGLGAAINDRLKRAAAPRT